MDIPSILKKKDHRPYPMPADRWAFYQEWRETIFIHWSVPIEKLRKHVPASLEIELYDGMAWVSLVAFTMKGVRPRLLPSFSPISDFHELNLRTYVRYGNQTGVYFLSIEAEKWISCQLTKAFSGLPYKHAKIQRTPNSFTSTNTNLGNTFHIEYVAKNASSDKTNLDRWLTERYALIQDVNEQLISFQIH
ncbi:MAG TPA: DUF2071 domain-containing protein, partial [Cytophagales bacterium]|nr:DUF2071 domain-containing protein [Cytophagales bacterium]